jgi:hypothetical protein
MRAMTGRYTWLVAACVWAGCAAPGPPDEPAPVTPPTIPWLVAGEPTVAAPEIPWADGTEGDPVTRPCPEGWATRTTEAGAICDPWPEGGRPACVGATAIRPGESVCAAIGRPCPVGEFPDDVPADALYVRAGATGVGTRSDPMGTLAEAAAVASAGQTIVVSAGELDANVTFARPVTLRGVCAERTQLSGRLVLDAASSLEDATVTSATDGIVARRGLTARGVLVTANLGTGIDLRGGASTLEDVIVRGGGGSTLMMIGGVHVVDASLVAEGLVIEGRAGFGLVLEAGASATVSDSVLADGTTFDANPTALALIRGGVLDVSFTRTVFENGVNLLVQALGPVTFEDVLVQGVRVQSGQPLAIGVAALSTLVARGLRTHDIDGLGLFAAATGRVDVEDYVAYGAHPLSVGLHAEERGSIVARRARLGPLDIGARAYVRGTLELSDAAIVGARTYALHVNGVEAVGTFRRIVVHHSVAGLRVGADGTSDIEDAVFEDIVSSGVGADGIGAYLRSHVTARRIRASRTANACFASLQTATFTLFDARCSEALLGLVASVEGTMTAEHVIVEDIGAAALVAEFGASLTVEDALVRRVQPTEQISAGLFANSGSTATLSRAMLSEVAGYGVSCAGGDAPPEVTVEDTIVDGATFGGVTPECAISLLRVELLRPGVAGIANVGTASIEVADVRIVDVQPDPVDGRFGHGVHIVGGGSLHGGRLVVEGARGAGLLVAGEGTMVELGEAWISDVRSAACGPGCIAGGSGIVVAEGGSIHIASVRSFGHEVAGVQVSVPASVALDAGWIHGNAIGRSLSPGFDETTLLGVTYLANDVEEDRRPLALPATTLF